MRRCAGRSARRSLAPYTMWVRRELEVCRLRAGVEARRGSGEGLVPRRAGRAGSIIANSFVAGAEEIARTVEGYGSERRGSVVGVDAPLAVPNERGTRKIERILSKLALPAYSASRRMFGGEPYAEELLAALERVGVEYTDYPFQRERGQWFVSEVDSAATLKILRLERDGGKGDLEKRLRGMEEPRFRKGNKEGRAAALRGAIEVLWDTPGLRLRTGNLSADLSAPENID